MLIEQHVEGRAGKSAERIRVMQVVDTLDVGGAERVAVNLASLLPRDRFESFLCTTRRDGPLGEQLAPHVVRVSLNRKGRFDSAGLRRMSAFVSEHRIQVLHAHGSSLFISKIASLMSGSPVVVWHDHYGKGDFSDRTAWLYRLATRGGGVIAVNHPLADWSRNVLQVPDDHVWYVPNFVDPGAPTDLPEALPGTAGFRVVCLANFRAQKDHITLLQAIAIVKHRVPEMQVLLAGHPVEPRYADYVRSQIGALQLTDNVTYLGPRKDVVSLLNACDIGVLSSASEGLPLALLEYGMARLPVVATDVGQVREVLADGKAGILVPASSPEKLAEALTVLLQSEALRTKYGNALYDHVVSEYHPDAILKQVCGIYEQLLRQRQAA